jgi:DNA-binding Lrp family transcriptional regulator
MAQDSRRSRIDARDRRLLDELQRDAWQSYAALAEKLSLSASAVQRRVERLVDRGLVLGAHARLSAEARGRPFRAFVLVELVNESAESLRSFSRRVGVRPEVVEASYMAGRTDVVLVVETAGMEEYAVLAEHLLNGDRNVRRYSTLSVLKALK